ncbi:flocculation protein FLO11 [Camponotus floridanus]|uniref:flocculation protein FLO11 n=1 Tax=Camponotus floridanus TaxID=104421 RepID=UPI000DC6C17C|nr:flocculation protein FLO11 [Camponotus floridanus]XP_025263992.1 flocculation protein FLO11 [Camponotus floridanus]XP_025263993.1 flocculation protein FLO11 [Camponotus floridanus]
MNMTKHPLYETSTDSTENIITSTSIETDSTEDITTSTSIETDSTEDITTSTSIETDSTEDITSTSIETDSTEHITTSTSIETDSTEDTNDTKSSASTNSTDDDDTASFTFINFHPHISDVTSADNQAETLKVEFEELRRNDDNLHKFTEMAIFRNHYMFPTVPNTVLSKQKNTLKSVLNQKSSKTNEDIAISTKQKLEKKDHISKNKHCKKPQSLVLWRPLAPPIQDLEEKSRIYKLLMKHVFTRESRLIFNYKRERRSSLPFTPIPKLLAICPPPPESTTSELLNVIEKPNTSKSDINLDSQSSKTCIFTKQAKIKTPKDSTNESNSSTDDESYIDTEQSTHSATHTDDDIRNLELSDNEEETIEESPPECSECALILVVSLLFVALTLIVSFSITALFFAYVFPFDPLGLSLGQNLEHTDTFTSVIVEMEEKILMKPYKKRS